MEPLDYLLSGITVFFTGVAVYHFVKGAQVRNELNKTLSQLEKNISNELSATNPIEEQVKYRELNGALETLENLDYKNQLIISRKDVGDIGRITRKYDLAQKQLEDS